MDPTEIWLPYTEYGELTVKTFIGKNHRGEKIYNCQCSCGVDVQRTEAELKIRKFGRCASCRAKYIAKKKFQKERDKKKDHRRAHHQPAHSQAPQEATEQEQGPRSARMSAEAWDGHPGQGDRAQEAQLGEA